MRRAARSRIVEGAVGMVEMALNRLAEHEVVELDEERKASMVSNLLVVLCGDQPPSTGRQRRVPRTREPVYVSRRRRSCSGSIRRSTMR